MDYEIEFHPVGDATKAGDAISIRYGQNGVYEIMIVDGGTQDSGAALVEHIRAFYGANVTIAHVVSTHPDSDHASGLREILKAFRVHNLWLHGLWHHTTEMMPYFSGSWNPTDLAYKIRAEYPITEELIGLANDQGSAIWEPFAGTSIGPFTVLSPTLYAYTRLVPQFRRTPDANQAQLQNENWWLGVRKQTGLARLFQKAAAAAANWVDERWDIELLKEGASTAAENETSTVLYGKFGSSSILLTADAGVHALGWACDQAVELGIDLSTLTLIQVPHHGSRSNVTPSILNRLVGPKLGAYSAATKIAVVSCPKDDETHPRKMVMNAFRRRGAPVQKTQGTYYRQFSSAFPLRSNEIVPEPFGWFSQVEEYD